MEFDQPYRAEAGDVLLSLQVILAGEASTDGPDDQRMQTPRSRTPGLIDPGRPGSGPVGAWMPATWDPTPHGERPDGATRSAMRGGDAPPTALRLIDASTGAGTFRALSRDLAAAREWGSKNGGPSVVWLVVEPVAEVRAREGDATAEALMTAVVELVPFMVRARDRIYRTGPAELALLMPDTDDEGMEVALGRLMDKVPKVLAERRLGEVRLVPRLRHAEEPEAVVAT